MNERGVLADRWNYIKSDPHGARALLLLLEHGKGTADDFDTMIDRIIESRRMSARSRQSTDAAAKSTEGRGK